MINENGVTLADLVELASRERLDLNEIHLLTGDGNPVTEVDFSDETPDLWFLGDVEE